ncbi:hypothetical protein C0583_07040 [Candidatus Parcubacteria bacterium]|nr:MAG: hypothetical protein C0583_07040 [Candidatus Parcubacteria bacterium]
MKYLKLFSISIIIIFPLLLEAGPELAGRILLQVENNGEAWYVYPKDFRRYYLGRPEDAFEAMRDLGLGISNENIEKIPVATAHLSGDDSDQDGLPDAFEHAIGTDSNKQDTDDDGYSDKQEIENGYQPNGKNKLIHDDSLSSKQSGSILLQVEQNGESWYVNPNDNLRYYLGRPEDAFEIMKTLGLGVKNDDLQEIGEGDISNIKIIESVDHDVPFVTQAPFGDWSDQRQQDGCEEVSVLMSVYWARDMELSKEKALEEIIAISDFELEKYGEYRDISMTDVVDWIFDDYFDFQNVEFKKNVSADDMIFELIEGHVLVVAVDGQILENPYFTPPGPPRHMLVVKGYDANTDEFITNDPGTRHGANYRYKKDILYSALMDYPTGYHEEIKEIKKDIIVVKK